MALMSNQGLACGCEIPPPRDSLITAAGREPLERDTLYRVVKTAPVNLAIS